MTCHKTFKPSVDNTFTRCGEFTSSDCVYVQSVNNLPYIGNLDVDPSVSAVLEALILKIKDMQDKINVLEDEINLLK